MDVIALIIISFFGYIIAYNTYGKFLARKIFKISHAEDVPSKVCEDGIDFVPTKKAIIFGHHYTSIAGTGPIVGPAIGIIWGWVPAMIWIFFGSIVIGAVHDFGALIISMRNQGKSVSEIAAQYISPNIRYIFFLIVFFELLIVISVFGVIIAIIFSLFPTSVLPVWLQIPIAVMLGKAVYKKGANVTYATVISVCFMYISMVAGSYVPFTIPDILWIPATGLWTIILLVYVFFASTLPVTNLLQPRDYINAWQLFIVMGFLFIGACVSGFTTEICIVAPSFRLKPPGAPPIWPFLCMTIVCGAISGFHSLVSSGTSSKQIARPQDALFVGYGAMLLEAALATLVIVAVAAGIGLKYSTNEGNILTGVTAWDAHYASWISSFGLGSKIKAVVIGSSNMMRSIGIPERIGIVIMGVFIASFAGTTLDSATRIQRYVISELFTNTKLNFLTNRFTATAVAVISAAILAFTTGVDGKGALELWPVFGGVNQILAALTLIVLTLYLKKKGGFIYLFTAIPCIFMIIMTVWGIFLNEMTFLKDENWLLVFINGLIFSLSLCLIGESFGVFFGFNNGKISKT